VVKEVITAGQIVSVVLVPVISGLCGIGVALGFKVHESLTEIQTHVGAIERTLSVLQTRYEIESINWNQHLKEPK
jgi:hypothetical protein